MKELLGAGGRGARSSHRTHCINIGSGSDSILRGPESRPVPRPKGVTCKCRTRAPCPQLYVYITTWPDISGKSTGVWIG